MIKVEINRARPEDAALLKTIGAQYFYDAYKDVKFDGHLTEYIATAFVESDIEDQITNNKAFYFIGYYDGKPAGYLKLQIGRAHV